MTVDVSKSVLILSNQTVIKLLRSKEASNVVDVKSWPPTLDTDDMPKRKLVAVYRAPTAEMLAYLDFRWGEGRWMEGENAYAHCGEIVCYGYRMIILGLG